MGTFVAWILIIMGIFKLAGLMTVSWAALYAWFWVPLGLMACFGIAVLLRVWPLVVAANIAWPLYAKAAIALHHPTDVWWMLFQTATIGWIYMAPFLIIWLIWHLISSAF